MSAREFDLGDVLSITTGRLVSRRHIGGVYDILGFMTGESLMTHQLPRASDECQPRLLEQHPQLQGIAVPEIRSREDAEVWLDSLEPTYGKTLLVRPLSPEDHTRIHPLDEAILKGLGDKMIVVGVA